MSLTSLELESLEIPFRTTFSHASASRDKTSSILVIANSNDTITGIGEACPRSYVTNESIESAQYFFKNHKQSILSNISDMPSLKNWTLGNKQDIDKNPAAWCAIEIALLDLFARENGISIEQALGIENLNGVFEYTAVLGDADLDRFTKQFMQYMQQGFEDYKLKLSGDIDRDKAKLAKIKSIAETNLRIRLDANNLWSDVTNALNYIESLDYPFFAIEEPLSPGKYEDLSYMADRLEIPIILDESFTFLDQIQHIKGNPANWILNLRVSKLGGLLRSLDIVNSARQNKLKIIVGAQVGETSILTRCGITVAHAAGDCLVAQEGAFGTWLLDHDICTPCIMFQSKGLLDIAKQLDTKLPGLGIKLKH